MPLYSVYNGGGGGWCQTCLHNATFKSSSLTSNTAECVLYDFIVKAELSFGNSPPENCYFFLAFVTQRHELPLDSCHNLAKAILGRFLNAFAGPLDINRFFLQGRITCQISMQY